MNKKIILLMLSLLILSLFSLSANAVGDCNITVGPSSGAFMNSQTALLVNISGSKFGIENITNATLTIGSTVYNSSPSGKNGSSTDGSTINFGWHIDISTLSEGAKTVYATCFNSTSYNEPDSAENSTSFTWNLDFTSPSVVIHQPTQGSTVQVDTANKISMEYTPTDTNLGNITIYLEGSPNSKATSDTTSPNSTVLTGVRNKLALIFTADATNQDAILEVADLAGNKINSSTRTFGALYSVGELSTSIVTSGGQLVPVSTAQQPLASAPIKTVADAKFKTKGFLDKYGLIVLVVALIGGGIYIYKRRK